MKSQLARAVMWSFCLVAAATQNAQAAKRNPCGSTPCPPPAPQMVEKTICVPQTTYVHKKVWCTEFSVEVRDIKRTVMVPQPKTVTVQKTCTVMEPKQVTRTVTRRVCKPVEEEVEETFTVCVPYKETKKGTRQVTECVAVTKTRKCCFDEGSWQTVQKPSPCGGCNPCGSQAMVTCRVWVPKMVTKDVEYQCYEQVTKEVPYECEVTVMKPETRTHKVKHCTLHWDEVSEEVQCTVLVPKQVTRDVELCTVECVPVEKTFQCRVVVPHRVEREVVVPVCTMVEKKIMVPACPCPPPCCP